MNQPFPHVRLCGPWRPAGRAATAAAGVCVLALLSAPGLTAQDATPTALLAKSGAYVQSYKAQLSALLVDELYDQSVGGTSPQSRGRRRRLKSDLMLLNLDGIWIQYRDTFEVDGQPVREHQARLENLFLHPTKDLLQQAQSIADEGARYNLGPPRNINVPTMALAYLAPEAQARSAFTIAGYETVNETASAVVRFRETAQPPLIQGPKGSTLHTSGRFWVSPDTGTVLKSELAVTLGSTKQPLDGTITVTYRRDPAHELFVPAVMDEHFDWVNSIVTGHAVYSNIRAFSVDTSSMRRGGGGNPHAPVSPDR